MNGQGLTIEIASEASWLAEEAGTVGHAVGTPRSVYEKRYWPYVLTLPISWLLTLWVMAKKQLRQALGLPGPSINTLWFDGLGSELMQIKGTAAGWKALDIIYNHQFGGKRTIGGLLDDFWIGMVNAQAVRNRLKVVTMEVRRALVQFANEPEVRIMSLACGSAEAVIKVVSRLKRQGITVKVLLVDINPAALAYAEQLAEQYGVRDRIQTLQANALKNLDFARDFKPHVVEMLGLLDYLPQDTAIRLSSQIRQSLMPGGLYLTCNIAPNFEQHFLKWVINWPMIYRSPRELADVIEQSCFDDFRLIYEPLMIHGIVVAHKKA
jgi:hypothetical protein